MMRVTAAIGLALALAACSAPGNDAELAATNALDNADAVRDDADMRADRLDELAGSLNTAAGEIHGAAGATLRNEAQTDLATAAAVRENGQSEADAIDAVGSDRR